MAAGNLVFGDGGLRLHGWLATLDMQSPVQNVRAFLGNDQVADSPANGSAPIVRSLGYGARSFVLDLPLSLADGGSHSIRVLDPIGQPLPGSPVTVCCFASGAKTLLESSDSNHSALLASLVDGYERNLPRSIGISHYEVWAKCFESSAEAQGTASTPLTSRRPAGRFAFVVSGARDEAAFDLTSERLRIQAGVSVKTYMTGGKVKPPLTFEQVLLQALASSSEFLACVRSGDVLPVDAARNACIAFADTQVQLVYTDSVQGNQPWFKPAWNPEYAIGSDYPLELLIARTELVKQLIKAEGVPSNAAELSWRLLTSQWVDAGRTIAHVPRVLYEFRSPLSAVERECRALAAKAALARIEPRARLVVDANLRLNVSFQPRRLQRNLTKSAQGKVVSIIIPTRDHVELLERCIGSLQKFTEWPNLEIMVIDNDSAQAKTHAYFRKIAKQGVTVLHHAGPFNFAAMNNRAVDAARGEIVGMMNNDIEALHVGWLQEIMGHLLISTVGAVGAKLLWPNGMVQHGGVLLGMGNVAGHFGNLLSDADWGDHGRNQLVQQVSGVTAACLFLRKKDYLSVGGMNEHDFPVAFNDVDLCLKLRQLGKTIVWTPYARLLHAESASRGNEDTPQKKARAQREIERLRNRWAHILLRDPAYHPSLNLDGLSQAFSGLALPPRDRSPRLAGLVAASANFSEQNFNE
jgi:GT2 family glycosyltransferase